MSDLERQELLADMRHRTALHCGSNHHETVLMVEMIDRLRAERDTLAAQVAQMRGALEDISYGRRGVVGLGSAQRLARAVLAMPASQAASKVQAVVAAANTLTLQCGQRKDTELAMSSLHRAVFALYGYGKAGESDE